MELWDSYDRNGRLMDTTLVRDRAIPDGLYHIVCEVLVRHADGNYLLMKRDEHKPIHPGEWEATAGGSAMQGENPMACIRRELLEETGLCADAFTEIALEINDRGHCRFHSFICTVNCDKAGVKLQEGETVAFKWISEEEFIRFVRSGQMISGQYRRMQQWLKKKRYLL